MKDSLLREFISQVLDQELDEFSSKITEPKRSGLSVDQLGITPGGGIKNIIAVYNEATPEEKEYWGKWYHNAKQDVETLALEFHLPFPVMAAIVAVLSPGNKWSLNLLAAEKLLKGDPKLNAYPRQAERAREILRTGNTKLVTGPKVTVFFNSLMEPSAVEKDMVLDGHAINIWRGEKTNLKGLKTPSGSERSQMIADYQTAAKELGVPVQAVQATTWYIWKYTGKTAPLPVQKGTYDVSRFKGVKPANDNAQPDKAAQGKFAFAEVNAIGSGAVGSSGGLPLGVDTNPGKKLMWSGDKLAKEGWSPTPEQVEEMGDSGFVRGRSWSLKLVPISKIDFIDFAGSEYEEEYMDPKGGPIYIAKLMKLMKQNVPLPPATGWFSNGYYHAADGNHRISAAAKLGIKKIPMVVYTTDKPAKMHESVGRYAYHGTTDTNLPRLKVKGLITGAYSSFSDQYSEYDDGEHLFFSDSADWIRDNYGNVVLRFPWPSDSKPDKNKYGRYLVHQFVSKQPVNPAMLEVEVNGSWVPLSVLGDSVT